MSSLNDEMDIVPTAQIDHEEEEEEQAEEEFGETTAHEEETTLGEQHLIDDEPSQMQKAPSPVAVVVPISPFSRSPLENMNNSNTGPLTPTTQANLEPSATVKYLLEPTNQVITIACSLKTLVGDLRGQLAIQLKMRTDLIRFILHDEG